MASSGYLHFGGMKDRLQQWLKKGERLKLKKTVILPVNPTPIVTSFSYYAFLQSIISAEERVGKVFSRFRVIGSPYSDWSIGGNVAKVDENAFCGETQDEFRRDCDGYIIREMRESDYIDIQVDFQQYTNPWAAVNVFISDDPDYVLMSDEAYLYRFGHFAYTGISLYRSGKKIIVPVERYQKPYRLVMKREGTLLEFFSGEEEIKRKAACELGCHTKPLYLGVQVKHGQNSYYPWLFSNFIQLGCNVDNPDRRLDYVFGISKHWENSDITYFLDKNRFTGEEISHMGGIKYLLYCLKQGKYIEAKIDQYYIKEREEFWNTHHYHQNLIYGADEKKKLCFLLGYDQNGKIKEMEVSFSDLEKSLKRRGDIKYKTIQYEQDGHFYQFSPEYFREMLHQYLYSVDSCFYYRNTEARDPRRYGLSIYEELRSEKGVQVLIADRRVAHVLWEHKQIMCKRICFLISGKYLPDGSEYLYEGMQEIGRMVFDLKNILLKYQLRPERANVKTIQERLSEIQKKEGSCLRDLYDRILL